MREAAPIPCLSRAARLPDPFASASTETDSPDVVLKGLRCAAYLSLSGFSAIVYLFRHHYSCNYRRLGTIILTRNGMVAGLTKWLGTTVNHHGHFRPARDYRRAATTGWPQLVVLTNTCLPWSNGRERLLNLQCLLHTARDRKPQVTWAQHEGGTSKSIGPSATGLRLAQLVILNLDVSLIAIPIKQAPP
jgi:hypothetical protein